MVAVGLAEFKDSIEAAAKEEKEGVEEGVEEVVVELSITDPVGVLNEFESPVDVSEILELKFLEELEFIKEDKDAEALTEVWRLDFEEAFAWWVGVTEFLLAEK